jgi:chromosome segregation ATPase
MKIEQMMEMLKTMLASIDNHQAKEDADTAEIKEINANMKSIQEEFRTHRTKLEEAETNRKADREALKEMTAKRDKIEANGEAIQEQMMARMDIWLMDMKDTQKGTMACQDKGTSGRRGVDLSRHGT